MRVFNLFSLHFTCTECMQTGKTFLICLLQLHICSIYVRKPITKQSGLVSACLQLVSPWLVFQEINSSSYNEWVLYSVFFYKYFWRLMRRITSPSWPNTIKHNFERYWNRRREIFEGNLVHNLRAIAFKLDLIKEEGKKTIILKNVLIGI